MTILRYQNDNIRNDNLDSLNSLNFMRDGFPVYCQFTINQFATYKDIQLNRTSWNLDKITHFSLRPPELLPIDMVGKYYRWFHISSKPLKDDVVSKFLHADIKKSALIDFQGFDFQSLYW